MKKIQNHLTLLLISIMIIYSCNEELPIDDIKFETGEELYNRIKTEFKNTRTISGEELERLMKKGPENNARSTCNSCTLLPGVNTNDPDWGVKYDEVITMFYIKIDGYLAYDNGVRYPAGDIAGPTWHSVAAGYIRESPYTGNTATYSTLDLEDYCTPKQPCSVVQPPIIQTIYYKVK